MRSITCCFVSIFAVSIVPALAGESVDNDGIWFCQSIQSSPTATMYVSDHFDGRFDLAEVPNAFKKMIAAKYGADVQPSCSHAYRGPGILEKITGDNQRWYQRIRAGGGKVVETHWAFVPAAERLTYVCFGGAQYARNGAPAYSFIYTGAVEMPGSEQGGLSLAWDAYLKEQHPDWYFPYKGCNMVPSGQTAQSIIDSHTASFMPGKAEKVSVNWKYAPQTASAAPNEATAAIATAPTGGEAGAGFYQCSMTSLGANYMTPGFRSAKDLRTLAADWQAYIRKAHPVTGFARANCWEATERQAAAAMRGFTAEDWKE